MSTTSSTGIADPNWTVNGPYGNSTPHQTPSNLSVFNWDGTVTNWIQPYAGPPPPVGAGSGYVGPDFNALPGDYTYRIKFRIPCDPRGYNNLTLQGKYWADNDVTQFWLNSPSNSGTLCGTNTCFMGPHAFSFGPTSFVPGINTLTIVVRNSAAPPPATPDPSPTALAVQATLSATCRAICVPPGLSLTKLVNPDPQGIGSSLHFPMTVTCANPAGVYSLNVQGNSSAAPIAVPGGSSCTTSEILPPLPLGCSWLPPQFVPHTLTIAPGMNHEMVTNGYRCLKQTGSLTVIKTISNPPPLPPTAANAVFTINVSCTGNPTAVFTLNSGGSHTVGGLTLPTACTVSEPTITPSFVATCGAGLPWNPPQFTPSSPVLLNNSSTSATVHVVNSFPRC